MATLKIKDKGSKAGIRSAYAFKLEIDSGGLTDKLVQAHGK